MSDKQAKVQPAETHPLYLCQFVFNECVFVNIFILLFKKRNMHSKLYSKKVTGSAIFAKLFVRKSTWL